jgi:hypothetical protein
MIYVSFKVTSADWPEVHKTTQKDWPWHRTIFQHQIHDCPSNYRTARRITWLPVELEDCPSNYRTARRMKCVSAVGLGLLLNFPIRLKWRWGRMAADKHDMISVAGQHNFKIVLLPVQPTTAVHPLHPNVCLSHVRFTHYQHTTQNTQQKTQHKTLPTLILAGHRDSQVGTAARPRNGKQRYRGSILGRRKWLLCSPKVSSLSIVHPFSSSTYKPSSCAHSLLFL